MRRLHQHQQNTHTGNNVFCRNIRLVPERRGTDGRIVNKAQVLDANWSSQPVPDSDWSSQPVPDADWPASYCQMLIGSASQDRTLIGPASQGREANQGCGLLPNGPEYRSQRGLSSTLPSNMFSNTFLSHGRIYIK